MMAKFLLALALPLLAVHASGSMDLETCKTTCQRFGMKSLGQDFASITSPVACCDKCAQVFTQQSSKMGSFLQRTRLTGGMDNNNCKVTCQRFGMKSLGGVFAEMSSPVDCANKCDEVY